MMNKFVNKFFTKSKFQLNKFTNLNTFNKFNKFNKFRYYSTDNERILEVNDVDIEDFLSNNEIPYILDCYTDWCQPCKKLKPLLEERVLAYPKIVLLTANAEENPKIADKFEVKAVPSVYGIFQGQVVDSFVGVPSEAELDLFVDFVANYPENKKLDEEEKLRKDDDDLHKEN
eukprot:TRINITY_DN4814_c0_g1_i1.p1 TRINITY_DN4814_c0_g1~~TRINITY_DN4814_c0_g1_i1.p1  ORF type:complete len:173 (-),score=48.87 TRINITY_DN4814_c0_g1_i1:66-584(-)